MKETDNYIEHEVKLRVMKEVNNEKSQQIEKRFDQIDIRFLHLENKIDTQFKWIIGTMIALFGSTFLPLLGGVILHMAKLI